MTRHARKPESDYATTKIDRALLPLARIVAAVEDTTIGDLLSDLVRGPLRKRYAAAVAALTASPPPAGSGPEAGT